MADTAGCIGLIGPEMRKACQDGNPGQASLGITGRGAGLQITTGG